MPDAFGNQKELEKSVVVIYHVGAANNWVYKSSKSFQPLSSCPLWFSFSQSTLAEHFGLSSVSAIFTGPTKECLVRFIFH